MHASTHSYVCVGDSMLQACCMHSAVDRLAITLLPVQQAQHQIGRHTVNRVLADLVHTVNRVLADLVHKHNAEQGRKYTKTALSWSRYAVGMHSPKGRLARPQSGAESAMFSPPGRMVQAACKEDEPDCVRASSSRNWQCHSSTSALDRSNASLQHCQHH